jgi:4-hydroxy-4-methyl-2-oxoglutarate aldolase
VSVESKGYQDRLMGLIEPERIARVDVQRPGPGILEAYDRLENLTSTVADVLDGLGLVGTIAATVLKPVSTGQRVIGPAITVRYVPDRISPGFGCATGAPARMVGHLEAYALAEPGDVLVVAAGGVAVTSCLGGLSTAFARRARLAGSVVDGAVRDTSTMRTLNYPVWARGITPQTGKLRLEVAEINGLVDCAGVQVRPGDLVLADGDGVAIVPANRIEEVLRLAMQAADKERRVSAAIAGGASAAELRRILAPEKW